MSYKCLITQFDGPVVIITLDRPEVLNALNEQLYREMDYILDEVEKDDSIKVVIVTGGDGRAFSSGADIHEMASEQNSLDDNEKAGLVWRIACFPKPTIGAINGIAYGGGALLASSMDIRVGCEKTVFKFLAASYGRVNSTWSLPLQVGWPVAKELLMTAREVDSEEANRIGLLNHIVTSDYLMSKSLQIAKQIANNDPRIIKGIKNLMLENIGSSWSQMYQREIDSRSGDLAPTPFAEAFKDFLDKKGRK